MIHLEVIIQRKHFENHEISFERCCVSSKSTHIRAGHKIGENI
jgi:hypothetical protein